MDTRWSYFLDDPLLLIKGFLAYINSILQVKEYLANPEAFAVASAPVTESKAVEEAKEEEKEEEEESDGDMVSNAGEIWMARNNARSCRASDCSTKQHTVPGFSRYIKFPYDNLNVQ